MYVSEKDKYIDLLRVLVRVSPFGTGREARELSVVYVYVYSESVALIAI